MQPPSPLGPPNHNNTSATGTLGNTAATGAATNQQQPQTPSGLPIYMSPNLMAPAWTATMTNQPQQPLQQPENVLQQDDDDAIGRRSTRNNNYHAYPKDHCMAILQDVLMEEQGHEEQTTLTITGETEIPPTLFARITKEIAQFPSFFHGPVYVRILEWYNTTTTITNQEEANVLTLDIFGKLDQQEVEPYDLHERLFRLLRQPAEPSSNDVAPSALKKLN